MGPIMSRSGVAAERERLDVPLRSAGVPTVAGSKGGDLVARAIWSVRQRTQRQKLVRQAGACVTEGVEYSIGVGKVEGHQAPVNVNGTALYSKQDTTPKLARAPRRAQKRSASSSGLAVRISP